MRTDEAYIRSLERRIRNQRAQLRWWNAMYERKDIELRRPPFSKSAVTKMNDILRRYGPWRVTQYGGVCRRVEIRRPTEEPKP